VFTYQTAVSLNPSKALHGERLTGREEALKQPVQKLALEIE